MSGDVVVKPYSNSREREVYEQERDIFALIVTVQHLEHVFVKGSISAEQYV